MTLISSLFFLHIAYLFFIVLYRSNFENGDISLDEGVFFVVFAAFSGNKK
jgi:hypothetical protein